MSRAEEFQAGTSAASSGGLVDHPVPLDYDRWPKEQMRRKAVVDPTVPVKQRTQHTTADDAKRDYWSPEVRVTRNARTMQPLKKPKIGPNPNVVDPHTVAFADYHYPTPNSVYIDYVNSRESGAGHASRLVQAIADEHPDHDIHFGKVMSPRIWSLKEKLEAQGRQVTGHRNF
jgi:hypothetical protein